MLFGALTPLEAATHTEELSSSSNHIIFLEPKLDKRTTATQKLLKDKRVTVKEFAVPEGVALVKWITDRVKQRGGKIEAKAAKALAERLAGEPTANAFPGRADSVSYNLWQAANEIDKLLEYSAGKPINAAAVEDLVSPNLNIEVWKVINAIADKNLSGVPSYLQRFFALPYMFFIVIHIKKFAMLKIHNINICYASNNHFVCCLLGQYKTDISKNRRIFRNMKIGLFVFLIT